jgi:hypothetical protein
MNWIVCLTPSGLRKRQLGSSYRSGLNLLYEAEQTEPQCWN